MKCRPRLPLAATRALLAFTYGALAQSAPENTEKLTLLHLTATIQAADADTIRNYLRVRLIDSVSMFLPKAFDDETFNFSGRALQGGGAGSRLPQELRDGNPLGIWRLVDGEFTRAGVGVR